MSQNKLNIMDGLMLGPPPAGGYAKPTYLKDGPYEGMTRSDGATRPDAILLNKTAWKAFEGFRLDFNLNVPSHVGLRVKLRLPRFNAHMKILRRIPEIPVKITLRNEEEDLRARWEIEMEGLDLRSEIEWIAKEKSLSQAYSMTCKKGIEYYTKLLEIPYKEGKGLKKKRSKGHFP
jgi:hypothetical protein